MLTIDEQRFLNVPKLSNMKVLSIKSTIYPTGEKIEWEGCRMPEHKYREFYNNHFNGWIFNIHKQVNNMLFGNAIGSLTKKIVKKNAAKPGGVAHIDGQESALRLAKEILG